jgi:hypothetical protein
MRKLLFVFLFLFVSPALKAQEEVLTSSYVGTYYGKAPCSDCKVIESILDLSYGTDTSGEFSLRDKYIGKSGVDIISRMKGEWQRVLNPKAGTLIVLNYDNTEKTMYYLLNRDGSLAPVDENLHKIESPIDCTLRKK